MIKDYKGEMPKNVTTPEKAKAKKPFYKDWKFWVLTGLMTLFGACSIYGLVLGSQYVKAIERASHIIANAQGSSKTEKSLKPNIKGFAIPEGRTNDYSFSFLTGGIASSTWFDLYTYQVVSAPSVEGTPYIRWSRAGNRSRCQFSYYTAGLNCYLSPKDYIDPLNVPDGVYMDDINIFYDDSIFNNENLRISGHLHLDPSFWFYNKGEGVGESIGYQEGFDDGYQEGYSDGSDAINVNQSVKVLLPAGAENSCSFTTYLDGVPDQQGILSSSSSFGAYGELQRNRNQKLRIDLTLPSGSRAFFMYVPHWTSAYPSDENYSLRQSWAVDGVTYLPTWVDKPEIYVGITSALVDDLTYDTISVAFDVDHWGDVRVGAYQQGYQDGYVDGQQNPTAYDSGYDAGYADGQAQGETDGFNRGVAVGSSGSQSLALMFKTAFQLPFDQLYRFLNFNLLGINFLSLFTALISVSIGIMVIKKVL